MKWTYKQKVKMVKDYLNNGFTPRLFGFNYENLREQIRRWSMAVEKNGFGCLKHKSIKWSFKDKLYVIDKINQGNSIRQLAAELGMGNGSVILAWYRKYQQYGIDGLKLDNRGRPRTMKLEKPKRVFKSKEEELEYLRAENAVLKKLAALVQARKERESKKK